MEGDSNGRVSAKDFEDAQISFVYDRCPVCDKVGKSLACSKCLQKDEDTSFLTLYEGKVRKPQSHLARPMFLLRTVQENLQNTKDIIASHQQERKRIESVIASTVEKAHLKSSIALCKENIQHLKKLLVARKLEIEHQQHTVVESKKSLSLCQKRLSRITSKKTKMKDYIFNKQTNITTVLSRLGPLQENLRKTQVDHIAMLGEYIFPIKVSKQIEAVTSIDGQEQLISDKDTILLQEELEEARRMSFVHGRWVDQQAGISDVVQIAVGTDEASAPSDGNYALYVNWLEANYRQAGSDPPTASTSMSSASESFIVQHRTQNSAVAISSALCHAAQMVHVIRKLLSAHLPHRLHFRPFPSTPSIDVIHYMEETLILNDVSDDDLDSDSDGQLEWQLFLDDEWETVPTGDPRSQGTGLPAYTSTTGQSSLMQQPSGLVTSALNWAKGWWGQPGDQLQ